MGAELGQCSDSQKRHHVEKGWTDNRALGWGVFYDKKKNYILDYETLILKVS